MLNTPMMRQYLEIKQKYPDSVLFFRMGDFYEMFLEDAIYASKVLDIALTRRQDKIPMCGVPYHAVNNYIHQILDDGRNIAICEQVEDSKNISGRIVRREVVRVITPGSIFEESLISENEMRTIAGGYLEKDEWHIAIIDAASGKVVLHSATEKRIVEILSTSMVFEFITNNSNLRPKMKIKTIFRQGNQTEWELLCRQNYSTRNLNSLEISTASINALGIVFAYLKEVAPNFTAHWQPPQKSSDHYTMVLDENALRTLEVLNSQEGQVTNSLYGILNHCQTSSGKRLLKEWLSRPLKSSEKIKERYDGIDFLKNLSKLKQLKDFFSNTHDLERILQRLLNAPNVRHLGQILTTLHNINKIQSLLGNKLPVIFTQWKKALPINLINELENILYMENLPPLLDDRRFVQKGYMPKLDELFLLKESSATFLTEYEAQEKKLHGITTLRIKYNKVLGYFIEISKGLSHLAPTHYQRRQTLVNAERFTSADLKKLEDKILSARDEIIQIQSEIFKRIIDSCIKFSDELLFWAERLSTLDVLHSFAIVASRNQYIRPEISKNPEIQVTNARHAVVEERFRTRHFVPNDLLLESNSRQIAILTGPNMAGKSTFIRQTGLIQIMAQAGSFVPAEKAILPVCDRIFTRIGAFDRLFRGESTFYVEMAECATIFQNFTESSLILLDEVGRGTSTYDGVSIARAMIEFLHNNNRGKPLTLFATHYAELSELIENSNSIIGLSVSVLEDNGEIIFLHKIKEGVANKSYGIHVADLAGLPKEITDRANFLLTELETNGIWKKENLLSKKSLQKPSKRNSKSQSDLFSS